MRVIKAITLFPFEALRRLWRFVTIPFWAKGKPRERYLLGVALLLGFLAAAVAYPPMWNKPQGHIKPRIEYTGTKLAEWTNQSWPLRLADTLSPEPLPARLFGRQISEFRLGLDLVGGVHLEYRADTSTIREGDVSEKMAALRDAIERRVNLFGVAEPLVQVAKHGDEQRLIVELAGVHDIAEAVDLVGQTANLEFRTEGDTPENFLENLPDIGPTGEAFTEAQQQQLLEQILRQQRDAWNPTNLNGSYLRRASVVFQDSLSGSSGGRVGGPQIQLEFNDEGAEIFRELTAQHVGEPIAIFLDETLLTSPIVQQEITGGTAVITGTFTVEGANQMVRLLNAGALPIDVELIGQRTVGATLGEASLNAMLKAGFVSMLLIVLFMVLIYRLPGVVALISLTLYVAFMLALYKLVPVTLTLAGIAGFILSLGMAVDANILIFARMREERRRGRTPTAMVEEGFTRAWTAVRDASLSTLITTAILYTVGTSFVQGFALALGVGVLVSLLTAFIVSRFLLREVVRHDRLTNRFIF